jgi:hypothetical protein
MQGKYPELKLPDEPINELIQIAHTDTENAFRKGDLCIMMIDGLKNIFPKHFIRSKISVETGIATETLRSREWVSRSIPPTRRIYELSFHQYRACLAAGDKWEIYAKRAIDEMDNYNGRIAPVAVIRAWISGTKDEVPSWKKKWEALTEKAESLINDPELPAKNKYVLGLLLDC